MADQAAQLVALYHHDRAENNLGEKASQLQSVIDKLSIPFFLFDEFGNYLLVNTAMTQYSEYSAEEYKNLRPLDFFEKEEKKKVSEKIQMAFSEGQQQKQR